MTHHYGASLYVFFTLLILLLIYDFGALFFGGYKATVSAQLLKFSMAFPIVALMIGILMGHLFWPNLGACLP